MITAAEAMKAAFQILAKRGTVMRHRKKARLEHVAVIAIQDSLEA